MSVSKVLITTPASPIYHNPEPTDSIDIEVQNRWKGKCLKEFFDIRGAGQETTQDGVKTKKELVRLILVWDSNSKAPSIFVDGVWTNYGYSRDALIMPGTSDQIRAEFDEWYSKNPNNSIRSSTWNVQVDPKIGTVEDAKKEMGGIFANYLTEIASSVTSSVVL